VYQAASSMSRVRGRNGDGSHPPQVCVELHEVAYPWAWWRSEKYCSAVGYYSDETETDLNDERMTRRTASSFSRSNSPSPWRLDVMASQASLSMTSQLAMSLP
jgi:hypothetical protein